MEVDRFGSDDRVIHWTREGHATVPIGQLGAVDAIYGMDSVDAQVAYVQRIGGSPTGPARLMFWVEGEAAARELARTPGGPDEPALQAPIVPPVLAEGAVWWITNSRERPAEADLVRIEPSSGEMRVIVRNVKDSMARVGSLVVGMKREGAVVRAFAVDALTGQEVEAPRALSDAAPWNTLLAVDGAIVTTAGKAVRLSTSPQESPHELLKAGPREPSFEQPSIGGGFMVVPQKGGSWRLVDLRSGSWAPLPQPLRIGPHFVTEQRGAMESEVRVPTADLPRLPSC